jgi:hypothetical protein
MSTKACEKVLQELYLKRGMAWWKTKRPEGWDFKKHFKDPTVNCSGVIEKELAMSITALYGFYKDMARIGVKI